MGVVLVYLMLHCWDLPEVVQMGLGLKVWQIEEELVLASGYEVASTERQWTC